MEDSESARFSIESEAELIRHLDRLAVMEPHKVSLRRSDGRKLVFGIGGAWSYVRLYPEKGADPLIYLPESPADAAVEFSYEGQPDVMPGKFLVDSRTAKALILQVFRGGSPARFASEHKERFGVE